MSLNFKCSGDQWRCPEKQLQDYFLQETRTSLVTCMIHQIPLLLSFVWMFVLVGGYTH